MTVRPILLLSLIHICYVLEVAKTIGANMKKYTLVVTKSTVPVGTARKVKAAIREELELSLIHI